MDHPKLRVLTWNLDGLEDRHLDVRTEAACFEILLRPHPPEIVMLQEVVRRTFFAHLRPHFGHAGYACVPAEPPTHTDYFSMLLARPPVEVRQAWVYPFPGSEMGRGVLGVRADWEGRELRLATAHLESSKANRRERVAQARRVVDWLSTQEGLAVFGGDTNLRKAEAAEADVERVADAFVVAGSPEGSRWTWSPRGKTSVRCRFDRVWLQGPWAVDGFRLVGQRAVPGTGGMRPSDHLGVEVELEVVG